MFNIFLMLLIFLIPATGCERKTQERHYEEIAIEAPAQSQSMMADPHAGLGLNIPMGGQMEKVESKLTWTVPEGWQELAGGGMRIATFKRMDDPDAVDVSIVSLGGVAGGLQANLTRWAGQIGLDVTQDQNGIKELIDDAIISKTQAGLEVKSFDYTKLQKNADPSSKSMVASMIQTNESTVFVKMTGTIKTVNENLESFKALTQSVRQK
jgi:hypothetical protein